MTTDRDIIRLNAIGRRGTLFLLTFSNGYEVRAGKRVIEQLGLSEGDEFGREMFVKLKEILDWEFSFYTAESMLARRPYSVGEFKQRLRQKEIDSGHIARIVKDFLSKGLLDDFSYSVARVQSLKNRKPAGRGYYLAWLQNRLVPREIADKAIDEVLSSVDEVETAIGLLEKKRSSLAKFDLETARRKAYTYLSRRAISYGTAKAAFETVFGKSTD